MHAWTASAKTAESIENQIPKKCTLTPILKLGPTKAPTQSWGLGRLQLVFFADYRPPRAPGTPPDHENSRRSCPIFSATGPAAGAGLAERGRDDCRPVNFVAAHATSSNNASNHIITSPQPPT